jgi:hypothetical protein
MSPTLNSVLEFLAHLFHNGIGYSGINTARSALSTFISVDGIVSLGKHDLNPVYTSKFRSILGEIGFKKIDLGQL